jgi:hypothetical protein
MISVQNRAVFLYSMEPFAATQRPMKKNISTKINLKSAFVNYIIEINLNKNVQI